jgi:hypothetical protein
MTIRGIGQRIKYATVSIFYSIAIMLGVFSPSIARADALISYGGSSVSGTVESVINLPGITVGGTDPSIPLSLSIDDGYLYMETTTGLSFTTDTRASTLSFSGSVANLNNALATLKYRSIEAGSKTLTATILGEGLVFFPGNGHLYEVVNNGSSISWDDASTLATGRTMNGATGYLATVTTQAENDYLVERLQGDGWFGASDAGSENDWQWVTGPEAGTSFWAGLSDGTPVSARFSNWAGGEPNDYDMGVPGEDCAQFYSNGSGWNDLPCGDALLNYYVVEYGAPGDMPTAPEDITFTVNVSSPSADVVPIASCLDLINVENNPELDNRYDTLQLTGNVDCDGEVLDPMFDNEDLDFGYIGFKGEFDGNGYTLSDIDVDGSGTDNVGLFSSSNDASFTDITIDGAVVGDYCVGGIVGSATNTSFTDVVANIDVQGSGQVGGVVGCYYAQDDAENTFSNVSVTNTLTNTDDDSIGGLIGDFESEDDSSTVFETISADNTFVASYGRLGGVIGEVDSYDNSSLDISEITIDTVDADVTTVGGVIGEVDTEDDATLTIENVTITGYISGDYEVGGLIGEFDNDSDDDPIPGNAVISNTHIEADITGSGSVSGLVGEGYGMRIENSSYDGAITSDDEYTAGLVAQADYVEVFESWTGGSLNISSGDYVGGLLGDSYYSTIDESYSTMTSDASSSSNVGGLVGYIYEGEITNSYARGNQSAGSYVGGLVGYCEEASITNSYATGEANAEGATGGLTGYNSGCVVTNSFWDTQTSAQATTDGDGTGKTTSEMKNIATFTDTDTDGLEESWDFTSVWGMLESLNDGYPCLQWTDENCVAPDTDDEDGISPATENASPNSGDANNDGTQDSDQSYVSSFLNPVTAKYKVVQVDSACSLSQVSANQEASNAVADSGYNYASGLVNFSANCGTPGYTTTVKVIVFGVSASNLVLRKYNPNTKAYFTITTATITDVTIGGQTAAMATYQIVDGGSLDTDGLVNGTIVDPVGLASLAVGVPNTGFQR